MKRVLFIAYYIPPAGGGGVQRSSKFIKYLPDFGWQPVILSVKKSAYPLSDDSLLTDIPVDTPITRTNNLHFPSILPWRVRNFLTRWFLLIDEQIGWLPTAIPQGVKILKREAILAIYSTSSPYTAHLAAYSLKKKTGLPWVADFRDPWIGNFSSAYPTTWHRHYAEQWESKVVMAANRILSVSAPICAGFQARYPREPSSKFRIITNGYDSQDFDLPIKTSGNQPDHPKNSHFTVVFSGSMYGERQTPKYFFQALKLTLARIPQALIQVSLIGNLNPDVERQISTLGLKQIVRVTGYLPHRESLEKIKHADLLLLIIGAGTNMEGVMTGKIFEYLAAQKPILALSPGGVAAELITAAHAGTIVPPDEPAAISAALIDLYQKWIMDELTIRSDLQMIKHYDRRVLTAQLAEIFNEINPVRE